MRTVVSASEGDDREYWLVGERSDDSGVERRAGEEEEEEEEGEGEEGERRPPVQVSRLAGKGLTFTQTLLGFRNYWEKSPGIVLTKDEIWANICKGTIEWHRSR